MTFRRLGHTPHDGLKNYNISRAIPHSWGFVKLCSIACAPLSVHVIVSVVTRVPISLGLLGAALGESEYIQRANST